MKEQDLYKYRLSIIVAIYNVEAYLERCISSLIKQDLPFDEYEILLVNDGSTDGSLDICNQFAAKHNNIIVYTKENGGLSSVRNFGIDHAQGRYIMHVDGDDFLSENVIGKVVKVAEENELDLCFFKFIRYPANTPIDLFWKFPHFKVFSGESLLLNNMMVTSTWCCIYNHDFLTDSGLKYFGRISHQDVEFNYRLYPLAKRVLFTDYNVYYYSIEGESITRTDDIEKMKRNLMDNLQIAHNVKDYAKRDVFSKEIRNFLNKKMNSIVVSFFISFLKKDNRYDYSFIKHFLEEAQRLKVYPVGKTYSWKTTFLLPIVDIKPLFLLVARIKN